MWQRTDLVIDRTGELREKFAPYRLVGRVDYPFGLGRAECRCGWRSRLHILMRESAVPILLAHLNVCEWAREVHA